MTYEDEQRLCVTCGFRIALQDVHGVGPVCLPCAVIEGVELYSHADTDRAPPWWGADDDEAPEDEDSEP